MPNNEQYFLIFQPEESPPLYRAMHIALNSKHEEFYLTAKFSDAHPFSSKHLAFCLMPREPDWFLLITGDVEQRLTYNQLSAEYMLEEKAQHQKIIEQSYARIAEIDARLKIDK